MSPTRRPAALRIGRRGFVADQRVSAGYSKPSPRRVSTPERQASLIIG